MQRAQINMNKMYGNSGEQLGLPGIGAGLLLQMSNLGLVKGEVMIETKGRHVEVCSERQ